MGGWDGSNLIVTTEVLRKGDDAWTYVGNLPMALAALRGVNLGNRLLMTGGTNCIDEFVVKCNNY